MRKVAPADKQATKKVVLNISLAHDVNQAISLICSEFDLNKTRFVATVLQQYLHNPQWFGLVSSVLDPGETAKRFREMMAEMPNTMMALKQAREMEDQALAEKRENDAAVGRAMTGTGEFAPKEKEDPWSAPSPRF